MTSNEFRKVTLGEISIDGKGSYGIGASAVDFSDDLYTYLRITDINDDGTLNKSDLKSVNDPKAEQYLLQPNDIVFARTGNSTGRSYFYDGSDGELVYAGFLIKFSLDPSKINPKYIRYYTLSNEYRGWVSAYTTGSTRGNINAKTYANMEIPVPPREQQDYLVKVLSSLDEKIQTNIKINDKLEKIAQELFNQWFINFEFPNVNGEPYKSSGGQMIESELGMIPKGWGVKRVGEIVKITRGASPRPIKDYIKESGMPWVKISDATDNKNKYIYETKEFIKKEGIVKSKKVSPGTLILSNSATPGIPKIMLIEACVHDGWLIFQDYQYITKEFLYYFLIHEREKILSLSNGSVFRNLKTDILKNYKIVVPPNELVVKINTIFRSFNDEIVRRTNEIKLLSKIRDTLLPKLMYGEIRGPIDCEEK